jgi:dTDP-4-amino-4,6-dideoxygalactose transaminase
VSSDPVTAFERKFGSMIGADYAIAVNSGTSALHAALMALDVAGGEVIMPALCPGLVAFPILAAGATPVFADVDAQTQLITVDTVRPLIHPQTRAIIAVALHGLPCDVDRLNTIGLPVIEDCAQALFARYKDIWAGTKAAIGCYSFERKKHMTTGSEGGMLVTNDQNLAKSARVFAGLGYAHLGADGGSTKVPRVSPDYGRFSSIGLNYRLSECQAEIGLEKLKTVMAAVELRQSIGALWANTLKTPLQPHGYSADNAFYSAAWPYAGDWLKLSETFSQMGGDGFYAAPRCPHDELALASIPVEPAKLRIARNLQRHLVVLKTHYRWDEAQRQAQILQSVLN